MDTIWLAGGVPLLATLLRSGDSEAQQQAVQRVRQLAAGSSDDQAAAIAAGGLPVVGSLLESHDFKVQQQATKAITDYAAGLQQNRDDNCSRHVAGYTATDGVEPA